MELVRSRVQLDPGLLPRTGLVRHAEPQLTPIGMRPGRHGAEQNNEQEGSREPAKDGNELHSSFLPRRTAARTNRFREADISVLTEEDAILLKFNRETATLLARVAGQPRFVPGTMEQRHASKKKGGEGRRWRIFLMRSGAGLHPAIEWLAEAHRLATVRRQPAKG